MRFTVVNYSQINDDTGAFNSSTTAKAANMARAFTAGKPGSKSLPVLNHIQYNCHITGMTFEQSQEYYDREFATKYDVKLT